MRIVLLGPPGAGKGSLASLIEKKCKTPHLSTGDIFRKEIKGKSALGKKVKAFVTSGRLVPDKTVVDVMATHIKGMPKKKGFMLDGFPRTRLQAVGLGKVLKELKLSLDGAIYLKVPKSVLIKRLSGRRVCPKCGAIYHVRTMRPKKTGYCDRGHGKLVLRKDDKPATIRKRLIVHDKAEAPLLAYYKKHKMLHTINGLGGIKKLVTRTLVLCESKDWLTKNRP